MNKTQELLNCLLKDIMDEEKQSIREALTHYVCKYSLKMNPNQIDSTKTRIKFHDDDRYYVGMTMKKGARLTVPIEKKFITDQRVAKLESKVRFS